MNKPNTQDTKRPWMIDKDFIYANRGGTYGEVIASTNGYYGDNLANAKFIVKAVNCHDELVEACKSLVEFADNLKENGEPTEEETEAFGDVYIKCQQALAKAESEN